MTYLNNTYYAASVAAALAYISVALNSQTPWHLTEIDIIDYWDSID